MAQGPSWGRRMSPVAGPDATPRRTRVRRAWTSSDRAEEVTRRLSVTGGAVNSLRCAAASRVRNFPVDSITMSVAYLPQVDTGRVPLGQDGNRCAVDDPQSARPPPRPPSVPSTRDHRPGLLGR